MHTAVHNTQVDSFETASHGVSADAHVATAARSSVTLTPTFPLSLSVNTALSEDYVPSTTILVDAQSPAPVAVFTPETQAIALVISSGTVIQVSPDSSTASGWSTQPVGGESVLEVAAGVQFDGTSHGFYQDGKGLYHTSLQDDGTWSVADLLPLANNIRVAYAPSTEELVLYGVTPGGDLQIVRQPAMGAAWSAMVCATSQQLTGTSPWLVLLDAENWVAAAATQGILSQWSGQVDSPAVQGPQQTSPQVVVDQVVTGYTRGDAALFMYIDANAGLWSTVYPADGGAGVVNLIPNTQVAQATGLIDTSGLLHVYAVDANDVLWVLHQTAWDDTLQQASWAPILSIDTGIGRVISDISPQDTVNLFAVDAALGALRFHFQDPTTHAWNALSVLQPTGGSVVYPLSRYRTEVTLLDANSNIVPSYAMQVTAASTVPISVGTSTFMIGPSQSASLTTDLFGKVTLATLASSVNTPALTFSATGLSNPPVVHPAAPVQSYLSGTGTLNLLPAFSADTLQNARVVSTPGGQPSLLAPGLSQSPPVVDAASAADAISRVMQVGLSSASAASSRNGFANAPVGFAFNLTGESPSGFVSFTSEADLQAYVQQLAGSGSRAPGADAVGTPGDPWSDIEKFFGDIWNGIKSAAIKVYAFVVDTVNQVVSFGIEMANAIKHFFVDIVIGLEEAVQFVQSVLNAIGAFIEQMIDWLRASFAWSDIWDTKLALESALNQVGPYLENVIETQASVFVENFFTNLEGMVIEKFGTLEGKFDSSTTFSDMLRQLQDNQSAPPPGARGVRGAHFRRRARLVGANGTQLDPMAFVNSAHQNSILDKILSCLEAAPALPEVEALGKPIADLAGAAATAATDFNAAWTDFNTAFIAALGDPNGFGELEVVKFLDMVKELCLAALAFADGVVHAILDVASAVVNMLTSMWTTDLELPVISALLALIHDLVDPDGPAWTINLGGMCCLIAAVPSTVLYKQMYGPDATPFPGGVLPTPPSATDRVTARAAEDPSAGIACQFVGVGVQAIWALFDSVIDAIPSEDISNPVQKTLGVIGVVLCALEQIFTWPTDDGIPFEPVPLDDAGEKAMFSNWMVGWAFPVVNIATLCAPDGDGVGGWKGKLLRNVDPIGEVVTSALGGINLITGIIESVLNDEDGGLIASNVLGPISYLTQFLTIESIVESSEGVTTAVKVAVDFFTGEGCATGLAVGIVS
jgi:hypothetical protein